MVKFDFNNDVFPDSMRVVTVPPSMRNPANVSTKKSVPVADVASPILTLPELEEVEHLKVTLLYGATRT
jgi:hypothetical protein